MESESVSRDFVLPYEAGCGDGTKQPSPSAQLLHLLNITFDKFGFTFRYGFLKNTNALEVAT